MDRQVAAVKERMNLPGSYFSTATGQAVKDVVLSRFDLVLRAFEEAYLEKWRRDGARALPDADHQWLLSKVATQLELRARDVESHVNGHLHEATLYFVAFWEKAGIEAMRGCAKMREKIDLLKMQKAQSVTASRPRPTTPAENPFDGLENPNDKKALVLLAELRLCFGAECWNACGILMRILLERAIDAIEPACRGRKGLGAKLDFCISQSAVFGQSMADVLKHLKAAKLTGDIIAHDSTLVVERTDVAISAPYFRRLITFWSKAQPVPVLAIKFRQEP